MSDSSRPTSRKTPGPVLRRRGDSCAYPLLYLFFLLFSLSGWLRMGRSIVTWYWLTYAGVAPGPWYLVITGSLWGLVSLAAFVVLFRRHAWGRLIALGAALLMALTYWLDRLLVRQAPLPLQENLFPAIITLLLLGLAALLLRPVRELRALSQRSGAPYESAWQREPEHDHTRSGN